MENPPATTKANPAWSLKEVFRIMGGVPMENPPARLKAKPAWYLKKVFRIVETQLIKLRRKGGQLSMKQSMGPQETMMKQKCTADATSQGVTMISIMSWNARGIRSRGTLPYLKSLLRLNKPDIIAILEPMAEGDLIDEIRRALDYDHCCHGNDVNRKIWLFWKSHIKVSQISLDEQYIQCVVSSSTSADDIACTFVYAMCRRTERSDLWSNLTTILDGMDKPWLLGGDFNTIAHYAEKKGGAGFDAEFMMRAGLSDPGFEGSPFTWSNNRAGDRCIWERLDRFLINGWFLNSLQMPKVTHLTRTFSDHCPILVVINKDDRRPSRFHYRQVWEGHPGFKSIVTEAWNALSHDNPLLNVSVKLKNVRKVLQNWNWNVFGDIRRREMEVMTHISLLEKAMHENCSATVERDLAHSRKELEDILIIQDSIARDKARVRWSQDGDRNAANFHAAAKVRRGKFKACISMEDGQRTSDPEVIGHAAVTYFQNISSERIATPPDDSTDLFTDCVDRDTNDTIVKVPDKEEIHEAIKEAR